MDSEKEELPIILYNLYMTLLIPSVIILTGVWSVESGAVHGKDVGLSGGLPMGALGIFLPEVVLGLENDFEKSFTLVCSAVWCVLLCRIAHYFFMTATHTPITYICIMLILITGEIWTIVIEFNQKLRRHILQFPKDEWLVPHSANAGFNRKCRTVWVVTVVLGAIFMLTV